MYQLLVIRRTHNIKHSTIYIDTIAESYSYATDKINAKYQNDTSTTPQAFN